MYLDSYLDIERKYGLFDLEIEGVQYWDYIRSIIMKSITGLDLQKAHPAQELTFFQWIERICCLLQNRISAVKHIRKTDVVIIPHPRRILMEGKYKCLYTDELSKEFSDAMYLEYPYGRIHLRPVYTRKLLYTDYIVWEGAISFLLNKHFRRKRHETIKKEVFNQVISAIHETEEKYNVTINIDIIMEAAAEKIYKIGTKRKKYAALLNKLSPKVIIEVVSSHEEVKTINEAAHLQGIHIVELQHGIPNELHLEYRIGSEHKIKQSPDNYLSFSAFLSKDIIWPGVNMIPTGYPYLEKEVRKRGRRKKETVDSKQILFISQGAIIGEKLSRVASELAGKKDNSSWKIIYKLHPDEVMNWRENYPWLVSDGISVPDSKDATLYDLFEESDIQIGVCSTALFEGLAFGLYTIIYDVGNNMANTSLVYANYADKAVNIEELTELIEHYKEGNNQVDLWPKDSFQNMTHFIRKEMET